MVIVAWIFFGSTTWAFHPLVQLRQGLRVLHSTENYREQPMNVLGSDLECCCADVRDGIGTGFYRDGYCSTGNDDVGRHTVCVEATDDFLQFSKLVGNDLSTPIPEFMFPGLRAGDKWCLCASRWEQARLSGAAPNVVLKATHEKSLEHTEYDHLKAFAIDIDDVLEEENRVDALRQRAMQRAGLGGGGVETNKS